MITHLTEYYPHLSTVSSPGGVDEERKSGDYIQQDSEDEIQQPVEELATTDLLGGWRMEGENGYMNNLRRGFLLTG